MEEKDIFDLFREESENLLEQPEAKTWQRLESRLKNAQKRRLKRKPVPTQWHVVAATLFLIALIGVVSWVVTQEHEAILRGRKEFDSFLFLQGKWTASEKQIGDELTFNAKEATILRGVKILTFKNTLIEKDSFILQNKGKYNVLIFKKQEYILKNSENKIFTFIAPNGTKARLRQSTDHKFTLSFDNGYVFVYKKW